MSYWGFRRSLSRLPFDRDWRMASSLQHRELHDLIRIWEMCSGSSNRPTWVRHSKLIVTDMLTGYCEVLWLIVFRILWSHKSMRDTLHPTGKHFRRCLQPARVRLLGCSRVGVCRNTILFCYIPTVYQCRPMCTNHNTYHIYIQYTQCTLYFLGLFGYSQRLGCLGFGFTPFTKHSTWRTDRSFKHSLDVESNSSWHSTKMLKSCQHGMTDTSRPR